MSVEEDLDTLYGVAPGQFTALRKELAAAAKKRGDAAAAKRLAAARRPTSAAWVVNALVHADATVVDRLAELTAQLRAAHAAMDGARIRELTTTQRTLVGELARAAFSAAEVSDPTATLRDDVTHTLQAAIADPEVASRLGRLEKAEEWSGFGDFGGVSESVSTPAAGRSRSRPAPKSAPADKSESAAEPRVSAADLRAARKRRDTTAKTAASAREASQQAGEILEQSRTRASTALRRYEKLLTDLSAAEREMNAATAEAESAERAAARAAEVAEQAAAELGEAEEALAELES
ncbi:hypothetical protein ACWDUN_03285 [Mycobacterium sp. NPDC003323]